MSSLSRMCNETIRKRASNFTVQENSLLIKLVRKYPEINSKRVDRFSNRIKIRSWQELAKDFNAEMGGQPYRTPIVLRHRYKNIKRLFIRPNQNLMNHQQSPVTSHIDASASNYENIEIFNNGSMNGEKIEDVQEKDSKDNIFNLNSFISPIDGNDNEQTTNQENDILNNFNSHNVTNNANKLPIKNLILDNLLDMQKKCFLQEHHLKLLHMKNKHELELELIRQEHQERLAMLKQEHNFKMELMELERGVSIINKI